MCFKIAYTLLVNAYVLKITLPLFTVSLFIDFYSSKSVSLVDIFSEVNFRSFKFKRVIV